MSTAIPKLAWRLLRREWRAGELRLIGLALLLAVAAVTSVAFFTDRVRGALEQEANQLLGADLLLIADHQWPAEVVAEARQRGLSMAETRVFPSMVIAGEQAQLADIKAVSAAYPLRGKLRQASALGATDAEARGVPESGTVWADERLVTALGIPVGETLLVGKNRLRLAAVLTYEPDRGINFFSVAPRLLMSMDDLAATGLLQTGSRVTYRLLLAGEGSAIQDFRQWLLPRLQRGERIEDAQNARPEIRSALDRAQRFLGLASLLTVILAAVAMSLAARRYLQRHLDACAVMRCLGATQALLLSLHAALFAWLALLAAFAGCLLGYLAHFILYSWLADFIATPLPAPSLVPLGQGLATAAVLLFGFAMPPLIRLGKVSTLRVLRREIEVAPAGWLGSYLLGGLLMLALMFWVAGDLRLGAWAVGGFIVAAAIFVVLARSAIWLAGRLRVGTGLGWRHGLAHLERHAWGNTLQIVALAVGFLAMLLLTVTRGELFAAWQKAAPPDAPNRFVINIQPAQAAPVQAWLQAAMPDAVRLDRQAFAPSPMIRARLMAIGGRAVSASDYAADERAQRLIEREFNLSWQAELPAGNRVNAGRWFAASERGRALASVEEGLAKTLGIGVGDSLDFMIAGEPLSVEVIGLRKLSWDSMRVNFFVLTPPGVLEPFPASYILSYHQPEGAADITPRLLREFSNLTVIDVSAILRQLQAVIGQVARAVQFVFLFTLLAGGVVLYTALIAAFDERRQEIAVMRALGARRQQIRNILLVELAAIGALAGGIAAMAALLIGGILAKQVFTLEVDADFYLLPLMTLGGAVVTIVVGWLGMTRLLQTPPLLVLREG